MLYRCYLIVYWELWSVFFGSGLLSFCLKTVTVPLFVVETKPASRNSSGTLGKVLAYAMCSGKRRLFDVWADIQNASSRRDLLNHQQLINLEPARSMVGRGEANATAYPQGF